MKHGVTGDSAAIMRSIRLIALLFVGAALFFPRGADAQRVASDAGLVWIARVAGMTGAAACPCHSSSLDVPNHRRLYIVAIGVRGPALSGPGGLALAYEFEVLPLVLSHGTADQDLHVAPCAGGRYCATSDSRFPWTMSAVGAGILPLGFVGQIPLASRIRLQLRGSGGILRLSNPVPVAQGRKFNFMADASATLAVRLTSTLSVTAGVAQNHISNGNTSTVNPGMDSRMIEIGVVRY